MKKMTSAALLLSTLLAGMNAMAAPAEAPVAALIDPLQRAAQQTPRAAGGVMLALAGAGSRVVMAGERGIVLTSDDGGKTWRQAAVPVAVTLTALAFPTPQQGWAVGHGGVVLHTGDGGRNWVKQLDGKAVARLELEAARAAGDPKRIARAAQLVDDGPDKPLLAVHFWDSRRGFAIGAYGLIVGTEDGGATWRSWSGRVDNPQGLHLNALYVSGAAVLLAGEQGLILRSQDGAASFRQLASPYRGSWFAIAGHGATLMLAGLRGTVYQSTDGGASMTAVQVPAPVTITTALARADGTILFANLAGMLMQSTGGGRSLETVSQPLGQPLNALMQASDGGLLAATFAGPRRLSLSDSTGVTTSR